MITDLELGERHGKQIGTVTVSIPDEGCNIFKIRPWINKENRLSDIPEPVTSLSPVDNEVVLIHYRGYNAPSLVKSACPIAFLRCDK